MLKISKSTQHLVRVYTQACCVKTGLACWQSPMVYTRIKDDPLRIGEDRLYRSRGPSHFVSRFSMVFWRTISDQGQCTTLSSLVLAENRKSWDKMRQLWFWDFEQYISVRHALMRHNTIKYRSEILSHETWYLKKKRECFSFSFYVCDVTPSTYE